MNELSVI